MNPRKTAAAPVAALSGFLPANSLLESLLRVSDEVAASAAAPTPLFLQSRNIASAARWIRLLSPLFDDLRHAVAAAAAAQLPPHAVLCLTELYSVVRRIKAVIDALGSGSALWGLLRTESHSRQFYLCTKELGRALDILPLGALDVTVDAREQVVLAHRQLRRAEVFVGPNELRLREELIEAMGENYKDGDDDRRDHLNNWEKMEAIMRTLGLRSASEYEEEIRRLEAEIPKQAGTGGIVAVSNIYDLLALVRLSKAIMFSSSSSSSCSTSKLVEPEAGMALAVAGARSPLLCNSIEMSIPDEFRCPITLDVMRDPVIVSSGHTYDRSSITRWLDSGRHSCPKSGKRLIHTAVIPNYAVKGLMEQWCRDHNVPVPVPFGDQERGGGVEGGRSSGDHIAAAKAAAEAVRRTAEFLVGKLATGSGEAQRQAAYEVRLLAKAGMDNRRIIAEAGAIPFLVTLLGAADARTQEDAVTALLNLSIHHGAKALIVAAPGAADAIVGVMRRGTAAEARENAAAALFSLSIPEEHRGAVAARPGALAGLVELLREGSPAGKRDAAAALLNLAGRGGGGSGAAAAAAAEAGAVGPLVGLLTDEAAGVADEALALLVALWGCEAGKRAVGGERGLVPTLVEVVREGTERGKENAVSLLLGLCRDGGEEVGRRLSANPRSVPALHRLAASGSPRARRKADALLRLLNTYCIQSLSPIG